MNKYKVAPRTEFGKGITHDVWTLIGKDGGPESVALCYSKEDAEMIAIALNERIANDTTNTTS